MCVSRARGLVWEYVVVHVERVRGLVWVYVFDIVERGRGCLGLVYLLSLPGLYRVSW